MANGRSGRLQPDEGEVVVAGNAPGGAGVGAPVLDGGYHHSPPAPETKGRCATGQLRVKAKIGVEATPGVCAVIEYAMGRSKEQGLADEGGRAGERAGANGEEKAAARFGGVPVPSSKPRVRERQARRPIGLTCSVRGVGHAGLEAFEAGSGSGRPVDGLCYFLHVSDGSPVDGVCPFRLGCSIQKFPFGKLVGVRIGVITVGPAVVATLYELLFQLVLDLSFQLGGFLA